MGDAGWGAVLCCIVRLDPALSEKQLGDSGSDREAEEPGRERRSGVRYRFERIAARQSTGTSQRGDITRIRADE
jgi:hypothetical protein